MLMGYGFTNLMREGAQHVDTSGPCGRGYLFREHRRLDGRQPGHRVLDHPLLRERTRSQNADRRGRLIPFCCPSPREAGVALRLAGARGVLGGRRDYSRPCWSSWRSRRFREGRRFSRLSTLLTTRAWISLEWKTAPAYPCCAVSGGDCVQPGSGVLGQQRLYIDGSHHGDASDAPLAEDWPLQVALAAHPAPRRVLSIGLGDGHMAATAVQSRDVEELVIVELNGTLDHVVSRTGQGKALLTSEKTSYVVDDGRRWLLANPAEKFDVIMMFPLHAAHAFSGALYSLEFFEILASHLTDGGILFLRTVDLYSTAKTLATVFPHVLRLDSSVYMAGFREFRLRREPAAFTGG